MGSPLGVLTLVARGSALVGVYFEGHAPQPPSRARWVARESDVLAAAREQLRGYFSGDRWVFTLPLALDGTRFQQQTWRGLQTIARGETISYGELARRVGRDGAARAVGAANARNPLSIVLPCHRVVGASGALTGYAGGVARKRWLLEHEAHERARAIVAA